MEYGYFFNKIQNHLDAELPLVVYRKPNEDKIQTFLQPSKKLHINLEFNRAGFVFSPFEEKRDCETVWMYQDECEFYSVDFEEQKMELRSNTYITSKETHKNHITLVNKAIEELQSGQLKKVVLSRSELQKVEKREPLEWFKRILNKYKNTFCYCWYHPNVGLWLGASPETLISLTGPNFKTMALAGTMPFQKKQDVIWGVKEKEEQQLVVDSILKELKPVTKSVNSGSTSTQKAGDLLHLKTVISGSLKSAKDLKVLVEMLHPTSAICGIPKNKSKNFILANENYNRTYYTGYLGLFSPEKHTHLFVNLRCMQVHEKNVEIYVGGGITALSNAEAEWEETINKSNIMKVVL